MHVSEDTRRWYTAGHHEPDVYRACRYLHSGVPRQAAPWPGEMLAGARRLAEERTGTRFNSCVINLYRDGSEGMAWHSDSEAANGAHWHRLRPT